MVTEKQIHCLKHALGLNYDPYETRNYYSADQDDPDILALIDAGLMAWHRTSDDPDQLWFAHVTDAGKKVAWDHMPKIKAYEYEFNGFSGIVHALTQGKARYDKFLDLSECYDDLRIIDIKIRRCKEADRRDPHEVEREFGMRP